MTSRPAVATPSTETAGALRLAIGRLSRRLRQEATHGHSLTQLGILATLDREGETTLGNLAATERVAPPTITKAVASLVDRGLVEKSCDPDDRRVYRAALTDAGRRDVISMRRQRDAWLATRLDTLESSDLDRLLAVLPLLESLAADDD